MFPHLDYNFSEIDLSYPEYRDVKWDLSSNAPVFDNTGNPVLVTGNEAIVSWCYRALLTERSLYEIFSDDYGSEYYKLINSQYNELAKSEAVRYIKECLLINPYIKSVDNITVDFNETIINVTAELKTIYGTTELKVGEEVGV